jgi:hypothetical protein
MTIDNSMAHSDSDASGASGWLSQPHVGARNTRLFRSTSFASADASTVPVPTLSIS